jgi:hypothetical protein
MAEITQEIVEEFKNVAEFLIEVRNTGTWFPVPEHMPGESLVFKFYGWDLPYPESVTMNDEQKNAAVILRFRAAAKALGGRWEKNDPKKGWYDDQYYTFTNTAVKIGGAKLVLMMPRDTICERIEVKRTPKVIPAVEAQPERVEETIEYSRECKPLFAAAEKALDSAMSSLEGGSDEVLVGELVND